MMDFMNNPPLVGFYALAAVAIFASLRVITQANPVHAILSMIVSLLAVAGIMFILGAPFAGALEIVVYAGAILVLFVFVIMMLNLGMESEAREERWLDAGTWALPTGLTLIVAVVLYAMIGLNHDEAAFIGGVNVPAKAVGTVLFSKYVLLVEVAALLLLAALVAAYHLGKENVLDEEEPLEGVAATRYPTAIPSKGALADSDTTRDSAPTAIDKSDDEAYEYKDVDPHDYVGIRRDTRKESD